LDMYKDSLPTANLEKARKLSSLITLDNKFPKMIRICDEYVIDLFVCLYEVIKRTYQYYLALVLKLCYHYDILRNRLKYYTEMWIE
jgi:hypothetical protein